MGWARLDLGSETRQYEAVIKSSCTELILPLTFTFLHECIQTFVEIGPLFSQDILPEPPLRTENAPC